MDTSMAELADDVVYMTAPQFTEGVIRASGAGPGTGAGSLELGRRLLSAARRGDTGAVLQLMAAGAPFTSDWLGTSPLHAAAAGAHHDTCAVLLRAGVSRDARTKVDRTPLHLAAGGGHARVLALLLARGAAVDPRDMLRMTPLHWACERGHHAAAAELLAHGADPRASSKFNKTPLQLAAARGHQHIVRLLEDALRQREAQDSVHALTDAHEQSTEIPASEQQQALESIERLQMPETPKSSDTEQPRHIKIELESVSPEKAECGGEAVGGGGARDGEAAALLRRHGITLLPPDSNTTVLNAIQSGRTVVLSDAGKLMLKDTPTSGTAGTTAAPKGVILTAAPARAPPAPGVKIFTLNNKLRAHPAPAPASTPAPAALNKKILNTQDMQIKLVGVSGRRLGAVNLKAKSRRAGGAPVKLILHKPTDKVRDTHTQPQSTLVQITSPPEPIKASGGARVAEDEYVCVPAEFLSSSSPAYLRAHLLAAHRNIHELNKQLQALQDKLDAYERNGRVAPPTTH